MRSKKKKVETTPKWKKTNPHRGINKNNKQASQISSSFTSPTISPFPTQPTIEFSTSTPSTTTSNAQQRVNRAFLSGIVERQLGGEPRFENKTQHGNSNPKLNTQPTKKTSTYTNTQPPLPPKPPSFCLALLSLSLSLSSLFPSSHCRSPSLLEGDRSPTRPSNQPTTQAPQHQQLPIQLSPRIPCKAHYPVPSRGNGQQGSRQVPPLHFTPTTLYQLSPPFEFSSSEGWGSMGFHKPEPKLRASSAEPTPMLGARRYPQSAPVPSEQALPNSHISQSQTQPHTPTHKPNSTRGVPGDSKTPFIGASLAPCKKILTFAVNLKYLHQHHNLNTATTTTTMLNSRSPTNTETRPTTYL